MILESTSRLSGHYKIAVHRPDGTIRNTYEFGNLITNSGMDMIPTSTLSVPQNMWILVGAGSSVPQFTDNSMQSFVAGWRCSSTTQASVNAVGGYGSRVFSGQSGQGQAAGTLAEVGFSDSGNNTGRLFSRALILDGNGQPTTITVLPIEFLTVSYELRCYWPTSDTVDTVNDSGTSYTVTGRACSTSQTNYWATVLGALDSDGNAFYREIRPFNGTIGTIDSIPGGLIGGGSVTATSGAYTSGNFFRDDSGIASISVFNGTPNLQSIFWASGCGCFQYQFSPRIAKDNTKTLELHRRISWARV